MTEPQASPRGVLASARAFVTTLLEALRTRLELLALDAQEAGERVVLLVAWTLAGLFCLFMGLVLATLLVIVAFWDNSPLLAVGLLASLFLVAAAVCALCARGVLRAQPALFASTLEALQADREALAARPPPQPAAPARPGDAPVP